MCIKNYVLTLLLIFSSLISRSQIIVDEVGDGWKAKVDSAMQLIKKSDSLKYQVLMQNCDRIEFIIGDHSTTKLPSTIAISTEDMKLNSSNNIASILVHESYHLLIFKKKYNYSEMEEERVCYKWEYDFLCSLPSVEDWLIRHVIQQIIRFTVPEK